MTLADQMRAWREEGDALKEQARARRVALLAELAEIDATLGGDDGASEPTLAQRPERQPRVAAERPRVTKLVAAPVAASTDDPIVAELRALAPWVGGLVGLRRKAYDLRVTGMKPFDIAAKLNIDHRAAANAVFQGRARLRELKSRGAPKPPANDADEEPEPVGQGTDARRGRPFSGGSVKEMPDGKFRWVFRFEGREYDGPVVADRAVAEVQRLEAVEGVLRGELPPVRRAGTVQKNGNGYRWRIERNFRRYLGPTVDTEEEADAGRVAAIAALDRGEQPATAPKYRSKAQREAARSVASRDADIPTLATDGERSEESNNIPILIPVDEGQDEPSIGQPKEEQSPGNDAFADLAPVPLDEIPALVAGGPRTAPGVPTWILDRLLPAWWDAYQGVVVEGCHPDVVAYLNDTTAHEVSRKAKAAETQIERLRAWEAGRAEEGHPLTDEDKLGNAPAAPDPLLAALGIKQEPKTQGDAKRAAMAAMSPHFHRLAPRQLQLAELYVAGKTNAEIAAEMGVRLATVDGMLAATRARLEGCGRYTAPVAIVPPNDAQDDLIDSMKGTGIERARAKLHVINGRTRAKTIAPRVLSRDERRLGEMLTAPAHIERPITRGDCEADPGRPCPWVGCSHHLYLDVNEDTGAIKLNFPHLEVWEMGESCSLDVADRGGVTLEEVGAIVNLTRESVRQIEVRGLDKMKDEGEDDLLDGESPERFASPLGSVIG